MKSDNNITQFLIYCGIFLATFGIAKLDTSNLEFENNQRSYLMLVGALLSLIFAFMRIKKEKSFKKN